MTTPFNNPNNDSHNDNESTDIHVNHSVVHTYYDNMNDVTIEDESILSSHRHDDPPHPSSSSSTSSTATTTTSNEVALDKNNKKRAAVVAEGSISNNYNANGTNSHNNRSLPQCANKNDIHQANDYNNYVNRSKNSIVTKLNLENEEDEVEGDDDKNNYYNNSDLGKTNNNDNSVHDRCHNLGTTTIELSNNANHKAHTSNSTINDTNKNNSKPTTTTITTTTIDHKLRSLLQIQNYLLHKLQINDDLDELDIIKITKDMNDASMKRRKYRRWLMRDYDKGDTINYDDLQEGAPEASYWNDNDIIIIDSSTTSKSSSSSSKTTKEKDFNKMAIEAMVNIIDDKFFEEIIKKTVEEDSNHQCLDYDTVKNLKKSLAMKGNGTSGNGIGGGSKNRLNDYVAVFEDDEDDDDASESSSDRLLEDNSHGDDGGKGENHNGIRNGRRLTRRMKQESRASKRSSSTDNRDWCTEGCLDLLIAAMNNIEEDEGRSTSIEFDDIIHQSRKLRVRNNKGKETPTKKQDLSSLPQSPDDTDFSKNGGPKKKKRKYSRKESVASPTRSEMSEDDDDLYAIIPTVAAHSKSKSKRRSTRRVTESAVVLVKSIIVDGKPFLPNDENQEGDINDLLPSGKKRQYKKRQNYGKRGPYKKKRALMELQQLQQKLDPVMEAPDDEYRLCVETQNSCETPQKPKKRKYTLKDKSPKKDQQQVQVTPLDDGLVSLSFLDWRRREMSTDAKGNKKYDQFVEAESAALSNLYPAGIDTTLISWDNVNKTVKHDPDTPLTLEPPRSRHSIITYGRLCSRLVNCLRGKGRVFARHEFFYSDIDKAWFNENIFEMELLKLGITSDTKLSRSEWAVIRKKIRKRPRLFSKKFISLQMKQLEQYRQDVRKIQRDCRCSDQNFRYDILAIPKIGTTVSAYHKGARMIVRGTVLARHRQSFLIQFERRELGWDWVPDIEIASHGVPELLFSSKPPGTSSTNPVQDQGSLPTGTSFGPLIDFYKREPQFLSNNPTFMKAINKINKNLKPESFIAERESLAKLINLVESLLERKDQILHAIECFHNEIEYSSKSPSDEFLQHYTWLQDNLLQTNSSLEAALIYQQVMYGKLYSGTSLVTTNTTTDCNSTVQILPGSQLGKKYGHSLNRYAIELGYEVTKRTLQNEKDSSNNTMVNSVSSAAAVLLSADIMSEIKYGKGNLNVVGAMRQNMATLKLDRIPPLPKELSEVETNREIAMKDLEEALNMLSGVYSHEA